MKRVFDVDLSEFSDGFDALILTSPQLDSSTKAIVDLEIAAVNPQAERLLGQTAAHLNGQSLSRYLPELQSSGLLTAALVGFPRVHERTLHVAAGVLHGRCVRLRIGQHPSGVLVVISDLSAPVNGQSSQPMTDSRFRAAFDNAAIGTALLTLDGHWLEVNDALSAMLGYSHEQLRGTTFQQITHPEDLVGDLVLTERLLSGQIEHFTFEKRYIHRDGHDVWSQLHVSLIRHPDGTPSNFITHIHDIGDRKRIESELSDSQQRLGLALECAEMAWWEHDRRRDVHLSSPNLEALLGFAPGTYPDSFEVFLEMVHPDDRPMIVAMNRNPETWRAFFEYRIRQPDGQERWLSSRSRPIAGPDGTIERVIGVTIDVTERMQRERELNETQQRLELALTSAEMGWWEWDAAKDRHRWSDGFEQLLGFEPGTYLGTPEAFKNCLHAKDKVIFEQMMTHSSAWRGEWDYRVILPNGTERWISSRSKAFWAADGSLERIIGVDVDITARKHADADLLRRATHDPLTNLPNRRTFVERLEHSLQMARRSGVPLAVIFLDLDRFKVINDTLGHSSGDALLVAVAERLPLHLRTDDTVARLGGDEFTMILPAVRCMENGVIVAEKILKAFEQPFLLGDQEITVGSSMGISLYPSDGEDSETLLRHADDAMRRAKKTGRNQYQFYRAEMTEAAQVQLELERDLRRAIEDQQLELHYQPQFELKTNTLIGVEALLRWKHPTRGYIPPLQFIPVAEDSGLIVSIGDWVLRQACEQLSLWQREHSQPFRVAVNVSALQFERHDLVERVNSALQAYGVDARWLELELTESLVMHDVAGSSKQLQKLRDLGVQVAIDDFGTGYSSLAYLQRLPIDRLKIDRAFIKDLGGDPDTTPLAQAIIGLAHTLGMEVVAEGIETTAQLEILRGMHCEIGQGYLLGRPAPSAQLLERLSERTLR